MKKLKYLKIILFIIALGLVYIISPKVTYLIQEGARYIYEMDSNYITRFIELVLACIVFLISIFTHTKKATKE